MDLWPLCHEFEPSVTEHPPCREGRCALNMSRLKNPPVAVVPRSPSGHGHELLAGVLCNLVPLDTHCIEALLHVKSVMAQNIHVVVVRAWRVVVSSGFVLVT
ncbi:hypothetical protein TNCV_1889801 [Trichonephila clavipes]|nr:hypothetical protein TNCV_1889801 [Trichonephila clavipes]